jgi:hypothetical protein
MDNGAPVDSVNRPAFGYILNFLCVFLLFKFYLSFNLNTCTCSALTGSLIIVMNLLIISEIKMYRKLLNCLTPSWGTRVCGLERTSCPSPLFWVFVAGLWRLNFCCFSIPWALSRDSFIVWLNFFLLNEKRAMHVLKKVHVVHAWCTTNQLGTPHLCPTSDPALYSHDVNRFSYFLNFKAQPVWAHRQGDNNLCRTSRNTKYICCTKATLTHPWGHTNGIVLLHIGRLYGRHSLFLHKVCVQWVWANCVS